MPCVACSLCQGVDVKLKSLLEDNQAYLHPHSHPHPAADIPAPSPAHPGPFDRYADTADILAFCQQACSKAVTESVVLCFVFFCPEAFKKEKCSSFSLI